MVGGGCCSDRAAGAAGHRALVAEVAALEADEKDRREMLAVAEAHRSSAEGDVVRGVDAVRTLGALSRGSRAATP